MQCRVVMHVRHTSFPLFLISYTVEPPNKGHFENGRFVLFLEAVPISEACNCLTIASFNDVIMKSGMHINT